MRLLVKEKSYINNTIVEANTEVEYELPKGTSLSPHLEPLKGKQKATEASEPAEE